MNRYTTSNLPPFVVHIESKSESNNLGNLHLMKLGKLLEDRFSSLSDIKRIGRGIISVRFKYRHEVNSFVDGANLLLKNWFPNFKLYRTGIVRGVDLSLSENEIRQGIGFPENSLEIRSIS